ncbi:hypothetical protein AAMO2058_000945200 [Amorphochlora amoebiformis]
MDPMNIPSSPPGQGTKRHIDELGASLSQLDTGHSPSQREYGDQVMGSGNRSPPAPKRRRHGRQLRVHEFSGDTSDIKHDTPTGKARYPLRNLQASPSAIPTTATLKPPIQDYRDDKTNTDLDSDYLSSPEPRRFTRSRRHSVASAAQSPTISNFDLTPSSLVLPSFPRSPATTGASEWGGGAGRGQRKRLGYGAKVEEEELKAVFEKLDENGDGKISPEELTNSLAAIGLGGSNPAAVARAIVSVDKNKDGKVDWEETLDAVVSEKGAIRSTFAQIILAHYELDRMHNQLTSSLLSQPPPPPPPPPFPLRLLSWLVDVTFLTSLFAISTLFLPSSFHTFLHPLFTALEFCLKRAVSLLESVDVDVGVHVDWAGGAWAGILGEIGRVLGNFPGIFESLGDVPRIFAAGLVPLVVVWMVMALGGLLGRGRTFGRLVTGTVLISIRDGKETHFLHTLWRLMAGLLLAPALPVSILLSGCLSGRPTLADIMCGTRVVWAGEAEAVMRTARRSLSRDSAGQDPAARVQAPLISRPCNDVFMVVALAALSLLSLALTHPSLLSPLLSQPSERFPDFFKTFQESSTETILFWEEIGDFTRRVEDGIWDGIWGLGRGFGVGWVGVMIGLSLIKIAMKIVLRVGLSLILALTWLAMAYHATRSEYTICLIYGGLCIAIALALRVVRRTATLLIKIWTTAVTIITIHPFTALHLSTLPVLLTLLATHIFQQIVQKLGDSSWGSVAVTLAATWGVWAVTAMSIGEITSASVAARHFFATTSTRSRIRRKRRDPPSSGPFGIFRSLRAATTAHIHSFGTAIASGLAFGAISMAIAAAQRRVAEMHRAVASRSDFTKGILNATACGSLLFLSRDAANQQVDILAASLRPILLEFQQMVPINMMAVADLLPSALFPGLVVLFALVNPVECGLWALAYILAVLARFMQGIGHTVNCYAGMYTYSFSESVSGLLECADSHFNLELLLNAHYSRVVSSSLVGLAATPLLLLPIITFAIHTKSDSDTEGAEGIPMQVITSFANAIGAGDKPVDAMAAITGVFLALGTATVFLRASATTVLLCAVEEALNSVPRNERHGDKELVDALDRAG